MTHRPRVLVLDHTGQLGGAEIALLRLVPELTAEWALNVVLFAEGPLRRGLESEGIPVKVECLAARTNSTARSTLTDPRVVVRSGQDVLGLAWRIARHLEAEQTDLLVANSLKSAVIARLAAWLRPTPWVWHLHDRLASDYLPVAAVFAMRCLARLAGQVVANSAETAALTRLPSRRVSVAYPGLPEAAFASRGRPPSSPVFGLLGRISETKGQREFLAAAAIVAARHPEARFRIVGEALFNDRPYAYALQALAAEIGIADRVEFTGWSSDPSKTIDSFTALVHASPVPEPFGQVLVEAMARGVPVIATQAGGAREILQDPAGQEHRLPPGCVLNTPVGRLVAPGDSTGLAAAMCAVLDYPGRTDELAQAARVRAATTFTVDRTALEVKKSWLRAVPTATQAGSLSQASHVRTWPPSVSGQLRRRG